MGQALQAKGKIPKGLIWNSGTQERIEKGVGQKAEGHGMQISDFCRLRWLWREISFS
jgi:hypothetical protein